MNYSASLVTLEQGAPAPGSPKLERIVEVFVALDRHRVESAAGELDLRKDSRVRPCDVTLDPRRWRDGS